MGVYILLLKEKTIHSFQMLTAYLNCCKTKYETCLFTVYYHPGLQSIVGRVKVIFLYRTRDKLMIRINQNND